MIRGLAADHGGALADFNRAIEQDPKNVTAWNARGASQQIRGDFVRALGDYEKAITLQPANSTAPRLARQLLLLRLGRRQEGSRALVADEKTWAGITSRFVGGLMQEGAFLAAADERDRLEPGSLHRAQAFCAVGMKRLLDSDLAGARQYWEKCVAAATNALPEYHFAQAELARLTPHSGG